MDMSYDKDSDEKYQKSKNDEERVTGDIEVFTLGKFSSKKMRTILRKNLMKEIIWT